jgi:hypothetical protein
MSFIALEDGSGTSIDLQLESIKKMKSLQFMTPLYYILFDSSPSDLAKISYHNYGIGKGKGERKRKLPRVPKLRVNHLQTICCWNLSRGI